MKPGVIRMKYRLKTIITIIGIIIFGLVGKSQSRDTLFFYNGQLLIGELKSISLGKIEFDADRLDLFSIKSDRIRTISAESHLYRLLTVGQEIVFTMLGKGDDGKIFITKNDSLQEIAIEDINNLIPLRGKTKGLWEGDITAGYSFTRSSDIGRFNTSFNLNYLARKFEMTSQGSFIMTQTDSSFQFDNGTVNLLGSYLFSPVWAADVFLTYQRNLEQGLARRYQEGAGAGYTFLSKLHTRSKAITGLVFNQEISIEGVTTPTQVEIPLIIIFSFFNFTKPDIQVDIRQSFYAGITQNGRFRQDGNINLSWKIIHDFKISVQLYDNFDNQPPGENSSKFDYGVVFGLTYQFSQ